MRRSARRAAPRAEAAGAAPYDNVAIITGASSGLGLGTTAALTKKDGWRVVAAVRSPEKMRAAMAEKGIPADRVEVVECDLNDLSNVRAFLKDFKASPENKKLRTLVCNAAVYYPNATKPTFSKDGYEECVQVNHLAHVLMAEDLLPELEKSDGLKRCVIVGSVTGNVNTVAGQVPPRADLGALKGFKDGFKGGDALGGAMIDGERFIGPKAYKDAKLCNMLSVKEMHKRYHDSTGVTFATMYPGCIADTPLFRNHTAFFKWFFPILQKNVTKGYISAEEAGERLASVASAPEYDKSGAYWVWKSGGDQLWNNYNDDDRTTAYDQDRFKAAENTDLQRDMYDESLKLVGLEARVPAGVAA